ncbi:hypothetical protein [Halonotius aquaticus]|uniref:hypothetical protein n=1 Tax=Halonotius aquaticus TaxID=2216978 RepID=UPI001058CBCB|nr:hypothetical protein [Halonotius aquaticus]
MGSENPSTQHIESAEVTSQNLLTIPTEVQNLIFADDISDEDKVYYWYIHETESDEYIYIASHTPREENSKTIDNTEAHSGSSNRTSIPDKVRNIKDISEGDLLYFFAHDGTKESKNPSVGIFTEDQMTSKIDSGIENDSDDGALFRPYTFTTPGMDEQDQPDLADLLDNIE